MHFKLLINPAFHEFDVLDGVSVVCVCHMDVAIWSLEHSGLAVLHVSTVAWFGLNVLSMMTHYYPHCTHTVATLSYWR